MELAAHDRPILERVHAGAFDLEWMPLFLTDDVEIEITPSALAMDGYYPSTTPLGAQWIADALGACLWTPGLADLVWRVAEIKLTPRTQRTGFGRHACPRCNIVHPGPWNLCQHCGELEHSRAMDEERGTRRGLTGNMGKPWALTAGCFRQSGRVGQPYGWHVASGGRPGISPGLNVLQPVYNVPGHGPHMLDYAEPWRGWRWPGHEPAELVGGPLWRHICHDGPLPAGRLPVPMETK